MPNGQVINAVMVPGKGAKAAPRDGLSMTIKGKIVEETDITHKITELIIVTDTGDRFVTANAPFCNTLRFKAMGKIVKLTGTTISKTSFKGYPAIYIKDILEVK